ncbi:ComEA family DNA-binding protein [Stutzerimonas tarimensis]|uniref:ComEA family DNA-binding protein n=1 Tax=Stutzerimonas tarimensis TaxID=1507735 RepID=A0ABV7T2M8_9GAMM
MRKSLITAVAFSLLSAFTAPVFAETQAAPAAVVAAGPSINLNTADAATLSQALTGIGAAKAEAIVAHRDANGPFTSVDDLLEVKGIGSSTLEKNRARLTVD